MTPDKQNPQAAPLPQNAHTEKFIYKVDLQEIGKLWAQGIKYPNGDPIALVDVQTFADWRAGAIFIEVTNVCPTYKQLNKTPQ